MLQRYSLYFAWLLACLGTLGSLYYSEIRHMEPCHLCWYQRIALYPMVIILGLAAYNGFYRIIPYVLPLLLFGMVIAVYQVIIQEVPEWQPIDLCGAGPDCDEKLDIGLGPISIPMLSLANFAVMFLLLARSARFSNEK